MLQLPLMSLALFFVAALTLGLAIYALAHLKVKGSLEFCLLMVSMTFYIAGFGAEVLSDTKTGILFWLKIEYIGISTVPALCIAIAIRLAGNEKWFKWWPVRLVLIIPVVTLIFYYTNSMHHLFYRGIGEMRDVLDYYHELVITKGPVYYANVIYLNLALLTSLVLFARKLRMDFVERRQAWILIAGLLGPWIAHLMYQAHVSNGFDICPFGFLITAPLFAWGVFGNYMVFLLPTARDSVYQSFGDAVLIVDNQKKIIDFNKTASRLFKMLDHNSIGKPTTQIFSAYPELTDILNISDDHRIQVRYNIENVNRSFILTKSLVESDRNYQLGIIIVLHEITDQVFLLDNLRESEERYRLIFENAPVGILQYDTSGKITTCNKAFVKIIGSSKELLLGLNMLNLPDQVMVKAIKDSLEGLVGYYEHEYHSVTASKVTPVRGFFAPIATKGGQIHGGVGIVEDFTERYRSDRQLKYREEFENILMTMELEFLNTEIGNIDHTFNRGLMSLGSFCQVDRAYIFRFDFQSQTMSNSHEWCSPGVNPEIQNLNSIPINLLPRFMEKLRHSEIIYIPRLSDLPED